MAIDAWTEVETYTLVGHGAIGSYRGLEAALVGVGDRVDVVESAHGVFN